MQVGNALFGFKFGIESSLIRISNLINLDQARITVKAAPPTARTWPSLAGYLGRYIFASAGQNPSALNEKFKSIEVYDSEKDEDYSIKEDLIQNTKTYQNDFKPFKHNVSKAEIAYLKS